MTHRCDCGTAYLEAVEAGGLLLRARAVVFYPEAQQLRLRCTNRDCGRQFRVPMAQLTEVPA